MQGLDESEPLAPAGQGDSGAVMLIEQAIRDAYVYLEALDRRTLSRVVPQLTTAQYRALMALSLEETQSLSELATRLLCDKANASGLVNRLDTLGLAQRRRDPADARRVALGLTPRGHEALSRARHARATALLRALLPLEMSGLTTMTEALERLVDLLQAAVEDE